MRKNAREFALTKKKKYSIIFLTENGTVGGEKPPMGKGDARMEYTDIHSHILFGVDDGAESEEEMIALLEASYADGVRTLCTTPHFQPAYYGHNTEKAKRAFAVLSDYVQKAHPDMTLHLGSELGYHTDCKAAIGRGECLLLGGKYLLMDFQPEVSFFTIQYAMEEMLASGYRIILAHVERYAALDGKEDLLLDWERRGARFQVNAAAFSRRASSRVKKQLKRLMRLELVHAVASDTHDLKVRPTELRAAEKAITSHYGKNVAELLLSVLPSRILAGENV